MNKLFRRFKTSISGNFALTFAIAAIPLFGVAGFAVDYSRAITAQAKVQTALDAAALAAIVEFHQGKNGDQEAIARKFFEANYNGAYPAKLTVSLSPNKDEMILNANVDVPTTLLGVIGKPKFGVGVQSTAGINTTDLQIAMVLDTTGSMNSSGKLLLLKQAAGDFIDNILPLGGGTENKVKFAIVPFSTVVRINKSWADKWWLDLNGIAKNKFEGCVWDRNAALDTTDSDPVSKDPTTYYQASPATLNETAKCNQMAEIEPLSASRNKLKAKIQGLNADGYTNTAIGVVWGMNVLRSSLPYSETNTSAKKFMIFLTDGTNTNGRIKMEGGKTADMDAATLEACKNAKAGAITLYSIRVMEGNSTMLQACASDSSKYYNLKQANQLDDAFKAISKEIWQSVIALKI